MFNLSGVEDSRNRPEEFKSNPGLGLNELMTQLHGVIEAARNAIDGLQATPGMTFITYKDFHVAPRGMYPRDRTSKLSPRQIALIIKHYRPQDLDLPRHLKLGALYKI